MYRFLSSVESESMEIGAQFDLCTKAKHWTVHSSSELHSPSHSSQYMIFFVYIWFAGVLIRRKKSDTNPLSQVFVPPILSAQTPTKFIIEVANSTYQRHSFALCLSYWQHEFFSTNYLSQVVQCEFTPKMINSNRLPVFLIQSLFP